MKLPFDPTTDANLWAQALTKHLDAASQNMGHDIRERLRVARLNALATRPEPVKLLNYRTALQTSGSSQTGQDEGLNLWRFLVSALPVVGLVLGLVLVQVIQQEWVESDLASIDSALLLDDLPPDAYTDPGFLQFLKVQLVQPSRHD
ncbi:MAG: DUF3619 family protein [Betaproteobacteria bacterium]|nr:DUF3619 family protein [Betaproteobacteria bacterium]